MPQVHFVAKARKAKPTHNIAVGDSYYWWKKRSPGSKSGYTVISKTKPTRQQLTSSDYQRTLYDIEDAINAMSNESILNGGMEDIWTMLEELRDELQEKKDNLPEQLQDSHIVSERLETIESNIEELDEVKSRAEDWWGKHGEKSEAGHGWDLDSYTAGPQDEDWEQDSEDDTEALNEAESIVDDFRSLSIG